MLRSGLLVECANSNTRGTLGPLVVDADARVSAITAATVVPNDTLGQPLGDFPRLALSSSTLVTALKPGGISDATNLLVRMEVADEVFVSAMVGGVEEPGPPVDPGDVIGEELYALLPDGRRAVGRIRSIGLTAALRWPSGARRLYRDLVEVVRAPGTDRLQEGSAGALVLSETSNPVGIIVGQLPNALLLAPLAEAMQSAGLRSLDAYSAQEQCARARGRALQGTGRQRSRALVQATRSERSQSSAQMLEEHGIRSIVKELEAAW